jgi:hypothetical protein
MNVKRLVKRILSIAPTSNRGVDAFTRPVVSTAFSDEKIGDLLTAALMMLNNVETVEQLDTIEFELHQLKKQMSLRLQEALPRLRGELRTQFREASQVRLTILEQALLDIDRQRREFKTTQTR